MSVRVRQRETANPFALHKRIMCRGRAFSPRQWRELALLSAATGKPETFIARVAARDLLMPYGDVCDGAVDRAADQAHAGRR